MSHKGKTALGGYLASAKGKDFYPTKNAFWLSAEVAAQSSRRVRRGLAKLDRRQAKQGGAK
jgi:hypothetical protein